jgi:hypothetical protein
MFRRLVIGNRGRARPMHGEVPDNPARGKAHGRTRLFGQTCAEEADRRRELKPRSRRHHIPGRSLLQIVLSNRRSVTPTKINRGGRGGTNGRWARTGRNADATREATTVCFGNAHHAKQA